MHYSLHIIMCYTPFTMAICVFNVICCCRLGVDFLSWCNKKTNVHFSLHYNKKDDDQTYIS